MTRERRSVDQRYPNIKSEVARQLLSRDIEPRHDLVDDVTQEIFNNSILIGNILQNTALSRVLCMQQMISRHIPRAIYRVLRQSRQSNEIPTDPVIFDDHEASDLSEISYHSQPEIREVLEGVLKEKFTSIFPDKTGDFLDILSSPQEIDPKILKIFRKKHKHTALKKLMIFARYIFVFSESDVEIHKERTARDQVTKEFGTDDIHFYSAWKKAKEIIAELVDPQQERLAS